MLENFLAVSVTFVLESLDVRDEVLNSSKRNLTEIDYVMYGFSVLIILT